MKALLNISDNGMLKRSTVFPQRAPFSTVESFRVLSEPSGASACVDGRTYGNF